MAISLIKTLLNVQVPLALRPELFTGEPPMSVVVVVVDVVTGTMALFPPTAAVTAELSASDVEEDVEQESTDVEFFVKLIFEEITDIIFPFFFSCFYSSTSAKRLNA